MRILVAGACVGVPDQGGATWAVLQYVRGLRRLGHEVLLVEPATAEPLVIAAFNRVVGDQDLAGRAALVHGRGHTTGIAYRDIVGWAARADLLLNLAGVLRNTEITAAIPLRVYVDLDPGFTQLWQAEGTEMGWSGHHRFATVGRCIGNAGCDIPTGGVEWIPTCPPVDLDAWPVVDTAPRYGFTTIGNWRSYGPVCRDDVFYGQKAHAVRSLIDLPMRAHGSVFEPAFAIDSAEEKDIAALAEYGWRLVDPRLVASDSTRYQRFIQQSTAEIGVAKSGYVTARCGWFSDRSVCYLASGRPVVAQDTGWTASYPHGEGLVAFSSADEAAVAAEEVLGNYERHRKAAREVAEEVFDTRKVLAHLLAAVGATP